MKKGKRIKFENFELPDILYPKSEFILIHKNNRDKEDIEDIKFKFLKIII